MQHASLKFVISVAIGIGASASSNAQTPVITEKSVLRDGFAFPASDPVKILIFRPEIKVGEQTTAGMFQPSAEWHDAARTALNDALFSAHKARRLDVILQRDDNPASMAQTAEYRALFRVIVGAVIRHKLFGADPLPGKAARFDWSLGPGVAALAGDSGADYGLFLFSHDGFASSGRTAAQLVASLMGARDARGSHIGYAALVDIKTGDLVWLNVDLKAAGDVRTIEGAALRIEQLLAGFPVRRVTGGATP